MNKSFRITKYKKTNRYGDLVSSDDEWSSFYDIGSKVTEEEYRKTENEYIDYIMKVCKRLGVQTLTIKELEINTENCFYTEGDAIALDEIKEIVQLILREYIWCKLVTDACEFHFGYDYYMYLLLKREKGRNISNIVTDLNVEEYVSPYL